MEDQVVYITTTINNLAPLTGITTSGVVTVQVSITEHGGLMIVMPLTSMVNMETTVTVKELCGTPLMVIVILYLLWK